MVGKRIAEGWRKLFETVEDEAGESSWESLVTKVSDSHGTHPDPGPSMKLLNIKLPISDNTTSRLLGR